MLDAKLEINMYFRIRNSKLYGGKGHISYVIKTTTFDVSDDKTVCPDLNIISFAKERIKQMAKESGVDITEVEILSREEFEEGVSAYNKEVNMNELNVVIDDGYFTATASPDSNYPGIIVEFVANDDVGQNASRPIVRLEKIDGENVRALIWEDKNDEDYTSEIKFKQ